MTASTVRQQEEPASAAGGAQTLLRGLDVIEAIAHRAMPLGPLAEALGLTRSTTHRLASALVDKGYLAFTPRAGYRLGPKLLQLGSLAQEQADLVQVAREHLDRLAAATEDTVHLGVLDGDSALYLDKVPGRRRINISSRVGDRHPLTSTGLGKALMLDHAPDYWNARLGHEQPSLAGGAKHHRWIDRMKKYVEAGRAFDLEENEDHIRCVAAAVRDAGGKVIAAISVSSAAQYMSDDRMAALAGDVCETARAISRELGWVDRERGRA